MKSRYRKRMQFCIDYLGGKCSMCPSSMNLDIDHIKPHEKTFTLSNKVLKLPDKELVKELLKCQLLCKNCHKAKTRGDFGWHYGEDIITVKCGWCGNSIVRTYHQIGYKLKNNQKSFYCSRECMANNYTGKSWSISKFGDYVCGTRRCYCHGCRCNACKGANTAYGKRLRTQRIRS